MRIRVASEAILTKKAAHLVTSLMARDFIAGLRNGGCGILM